MAKTTGYLFRCSATELDQLHKEAAELQTSVQALMEHRMLGRPLETERDRRRRASRQDPKLPLPEGAFGMTG